MFSNFNKLRLVTLLFILQFAVAAIAQDETETEIEKEKPPKVVTAIRFVGVDKMTTLYAYVDSY